MHKEMARYILSHDIGTSGCKSALFDLDGRLLSSTSREYQISYPMPGRAEQNPEDWWDAVVLSTRDILKMERIISTEIAVVSFSGQMEDSIFLGRNHDVIRPAILHIDSRANAEAQWLKEKLGEEKINALTGNFVDGECTLSKILWLKNNEPENFRQTKIFLSGAKDYIALRFSKDRAYTDYVDASISFLLDIKKNGWCDLLLSQIGITKDNLPEVVPSSTVIGQVSAEAANKTGLACGTPLVVGAGDAGCAAVGAGSVQQKDTCANIGSSSWVATISDHPLIGKPKGLYNLKHPDPSLFMPIGSVISAGHSYRWLAQLFGEAQVEKAESQGVMKYSVMDKAAERVAPGSDGLIFLPYMMGERTPHRDHDARGVFFGLSLNHQRDHLIRAVLEGVAYGLRSVIDTFEEADLRISDVTVFGGGTKGSIWQEIIANVLEKKVTVPEILGEISCLGAAVIGGIGIGTYRSYAKAKELVRMQRTVYPDPAISRRYSDFYKVYLSLYPSLKPSFQELAKVRESGSV